MRNLWMAVACLVLASCNKAPATSPGQAAVASASETLQTADWRSRFDHQLRLLGHRNWIVIADSAFPELNAPGIETVDTGEDMLPVLKYVLARMVADEHVKPIVYRDRELNFITNEQSPGIRRSVDETDGALKDLPVQTLLHESVFAKLQTESGLFKVLVLKTRSTHPYTSVFLQLDCGYWDAAREAALRKAMQ